MPVISDFDGIKILMYYDDHNPPHFHAVYSGREAIIDIQKGYVIRGALPGKQLKYVLAWSEWHKDELMRNWELAKAEQPLFRIVPLM